MPSSTQLTTVLVIALTVLIVRLEVSWPRDIEQVRVADRSHATIGCPSEATVLSSHIQFIAQRPLVRHDYLLWALSVRPESQVLKSGAKQNGHANRW